MIDPRILTGLIIAALVVWSVVMIYAGKSFVITIMGRRVYRGDPMRVGVFATSIVFVAGCLRWLIAPSDMTLLAMIFTLSVIDALYIIRLMRAYGRGGPI